MFHIKIHNINEHFDYFFLGEQNEKCNYVRIVICNHCKRDGGNTGI